MVDTNPSNEEHGTTYNLSGGFQGATINIHSTIQGTPPSQDGPGGASTEQYNLGNIRLLLLNGFSEGELRSLRFDLPEFAPVYQEISTHAAKGQIVATLIEYAEQHLQLDKLLRWGQEKNPARYNHHQPYITK